MSEQEQMAQDSGNAVGGSALKALAGAAAGGAATYAVRKALASRNGHDDEARDEAASKHEAPEDSAREEEDDSEYADDEDRLEDSAEEGDEGSEESEDSDEQEDEPEGSAEEDDEDYDDDSRERTANGSDRPRAKRSLRTLVNPSRLASASQLLLPLAEEAAGSAGRYVGEHAPETVREQILPRFIDAFEDAA